MSGELHAAVQAVGAKALAALAGSPGTKRAFAVDAYTFANFKQPAVLIGIAIPQGSCVLAMDMAEWVNLDDMPIEMMLEFSGLTRPTPFEKAKTELGK
jgi:hypothetical protein